MAMCTPNIETFETKFFHLLLMLPPNGQATEIKLDPGKVRLSRLSSLQCDLVLLSGAFNPGDSVVKSICDNPWKFTASSNERIASESLTYSKVISAGDSHTDKENKVVCMLVCILWTIRDYTASFPWRMGFVRLKSIHRIQN